MVLRTIKKPGRGCRAAPCTLHLNLNCLFMLKNIILIIFCLFSFTGIQAQTVKMDSAALSKIISQQVKDTATGKSILKLSDTSVAVIITRLENYTLMLNEVMSTLRRGLDTASISENLPLIDSSLLIIRRDIAALG